VVWSSTIFNNISLFFLALVIFLWLPIIKECSLKAISIFWSFDIMNK
jgi:hypothetical protein